PVAFEWMRAIARRDAYQGQGSSEVISIVTRQQRGRVAPRSTTTVLLRIAAGTLFLALLGLGAFEGYRAYAFYSDLQMVRTSLLELRDDLSLESLEDSEESVLRNQAMLE